MSNINDAKYLEFLQRLNARYRDSTAGKPVFTTNLNKERIWEYYLGSFENRQYHNCFTCRSFLNHYVGLVTIDPDGRVRSALWNTADATDESERAAISHFRKTVEAAKVTGVFYSDLPTLGQGQTGEWRHFNVNNPTVWNDKQKTAGQAMAAKREEHGIVVRALREFTTAHIVSARKALESGKLYRAERVLPQLEWFSDLHNNANHDKDPVVWLAVANAPDNFAHVRSTMLGTLLQDVAAGFDFEQIKARFNAKMQPDVYQRAQSAPKIGQIEAAEKAVAALGIAPAFERRYTDELDLMHYYVWEPTRVIVQQPRRAGKASGVFADLRPQPAEPGEVVVPPRTMTWEKFARDVLPQAAKIEYRVPMVGRFCALTAAADNAAPPILQWDRPNERNTVSWAFPNPPARAEDWNLKAGELVPVKGIVRSPNLWAADSIGVHHGEGVFLLLQGAKDIRGLPGGGLFVEHLRSDLKPYRATIEAHMNKLTVQGADVANAAFGIGLLAGNDWSERAMPAPRSPGQQVKAPGKVHVILVIDDSGSMASYITAARQALVSLLDAVRAMPGEVDVTVYKFGNSTKVLCKRAALSHLHGIENELNGSSGNTALNDTVAQAITSENPVVGKDEAYFLGIVTDGEENHSHQHTEASVERIVREVLNTGAWTIAYAGAGRNPTMYAEDIGIPPGNIATFEASNAGFRDVGTRYATATRDLAAGYATGQRATTSFFASGTGTRKIGDDYPVLVVTTRTGNVNSYMLDRWE